MVWSMVTSLIYCLNDVEYFRSFAQKTLWSSYVLYQVIADAFMMIQSLFESGEIK